MADGKVSKMGADTFFQDSYPMAQFGQRDGQPYFGRLSARTKFVAALPTLGCLALRYVKIGYMKKFFTDDYPRASLSVMSTFLILSTLLDLLFDPLVATLTDGTRKIFGRDWGRRRPFLFVCTLVMSLSYALAFAPPASLSSQAQADFEAWSSSNPGSTDVPIFNSVGAATWYGVFHIMVKVVSDALFDIPHGALLTELTPDSQEKTVLWSWREICLCLGILGGMVLPIIGESECASSPETGCYSYLMIVVVFGFFFSLSTLFLCRDIKERPVANLPKEAEALVPSLVGCLSNYPFKVLLVSDVVEGLGANMPLLVLPYVVDWVVGKAAAEALVGSAGTLFAGCVVVHMIVRVPVTFLWQKAAKKWGKYWTFMAYNVVYGCYMFVFLSIGKGSALLGLITCAVWGVAYAGHWLLFDLTSDAVDYDELLTGERREGQFTMARELVPKICEIPADAVPFLLMSYFNYNPDLPEQNEAVQWIIRGSLSVVPGLAGLGGAVALLWYNLRTEAQQQDIIAGIQRHQEGKVTTDPLTGLLLPPINVQDDGSVEYEGSMVACEPKKILDYFFASEIRWACESGDLGRLQLGTARRGRMCVWQYVCNARMYVEIN
ncbi:unnamed protein product [Effrenium voratum]|uniref:Uncharacterized protein n=2 Tax=Effrenium voratum TaxID=2562239 RepID=A0AA36N2P0_9DINO|nr:unnamed protein product [Effrenium voratum]